LCRAQTRLICKDVGPSRILAPSFSAASKYSVVNHVAARITCVFLKPVLDLQSSEIREIHAIACNQHQIVHGSDRRDLGIRVSRGAARLTEPGTLFSLPLRGTSIEADDRKGRQDTSEQIAFDPVAALACG